MTFPGRFAPLDERLWALADLLRRLPIEFDGIRLDGSIITDIESAALILKMHGECPKPAVKPMRQSTHGRDFLRRNYG